MSQILAIILHSGAAFARNFRYFPPKV